MSGLEYDWQSINHLRFKCQHIIEGEENKMWISSNKIRKHSAHLSPLWSIARSSSSKLSTSRFINEYLLHQDCDLYLFDLPRSMCFHWSPHVADGICGFFFCAGTGTFSSEASGLGRRLAGEVEPRDQNYWYAQTNSSVVGETFTSCSPPVMHVFRVLLLFSAKKL